MADPYWHNFVKSLDDYQRNQLSQALLDFHTQRDHSLVSQDAIDSSMYTAASRSPTLHPSIRTSLQSSSAHSYDTISLDSTPLPAAHAQADIADWEKTRDVDVSLPHLSLVPHTSHGNTEDMAVSQHASLPDLRQTRPKSKPFFCTYCHESGIQTSFGTKADWKRHEKSFHETGEEWPCQVHDCEEVFTNEEKFKAHYEKQHGYILDTRGFRVPLPEERVYACGFSTCRHLTYTWKERCNHVAACMSQAALYSGADWSYTTRFLNLLRQPSVGPTWKRVKSHWLTVLGLDTSQLHWDCKTSRLMRHQLEYRTFDRNNLEPFLERVLKVGLRKSPRSHYIGTQPRRPNPMATLPIAMPVAAAGLEAASNSYTQSFQSGSGRPYNEHRHPNSRNFENVAESYVTDNGKNEDETMLDTSGLNGNEANIPQQGQGAPNAEPELMTWAHFLNSTSPTFSQSTPELASTPTPEMAKLSPGRSLMRRSKEWLCERRSPQSQPRLVIDNIDPALNLGGATSSTERTNLVNPAHLHIANSYGNYGI